MYNVCAREWLHKFKLLIFHRVFYPLFVFLKCFIITISILTVLCLQHVNVYEKFPLFTAKLLEIDKQKPWSWTSAPALVKASLDNTQEL